MSNLFAQFLQESGLYDEIEITPGNISELIDLIAGNVRIDSYCSECGSNRVFSMNPITFMVNNKGQLCDENLAAYLQHFQKAQASAPFFGGETRSDQNWFWSNWPCCKATRVIHFPFVCSMDETHHLDYVIRTQGNIMLKIGQYPSVADLTFPELKEFRKVVSADDLKELRKAIGLHAQGIGVGAFVYVRRIFERLIDKAKELAIADGNIDKTEYLESHVAERISLLKNYLPDTIVQNKTFYSIVSKGIHELSEEDCIAYFPVMREGIMLILRQWRAKQDEAETARKLATSLSKITANISKEGNN